MGVGLPTGGRHGYEKNSNDRDLRGRRRDYRGGGWGHIERISHKIGMILAGLGVGLGSVAAGYIGVR